MAKDAWGHGSEKRGSEKRLDARVAPTQFGTPAHQFGISQITSNMDEEEILQMSAWEREGVARAQAKASASQRGEDFR